MAGQWRQCQTAIHELLTWLVLLGPALRVKAVIPVVPRLPASLARPDDPPSQLQQQLLGGGTGESVGVGVVTRLGAVPAQLYHQFFGFSTRQDGVELPGAQPSLFSNMA